MVVLGVDEQAICQTHEDIRQESIPVHLPASADASSMGGLRLHGQLLQLYPHGAHRQRSAGVPAPIPALEHWQPLSWQHQGCSSCGSRCVGTAAPGALRESAAAARMKA